MIIFFHSESKVSSVEFGQNITTDKNLNIIGKSPESAMIQLAETFPDEILVWCRQELKNHLNRQGIPRLIRNPLNMVSYRLQGDSFGGDLDYIDYSTSIKVIKGVRYPTWKMSSTVGAVTGGIISGLRLSAFGDFDYFLNAISKNLQSEGLLCYQEPSLLLNTAPEIEESKISERDVFEFVWSQVSPRWAFFLFVAKGIFQKKWLIGPWFYLFRKRRKAVPKFISHQIRNYPFQKNTGLLPIDVLIPTLGREKYVKDLLYDLKNQLILPRKIIIVEQEKEENTGSQMDFILKEEWPFGIDHIYTEDRGPCMARNLGLDRIESEWVFLADDDIRIPKDFFNQVIKSLNWTDVEACTISCLTEGQIEPHKYIHQTRIFGAGCSLVKKSVLEKVRFDLAYEFGYAEDSDFGAQIRNLGNDVVYLPSPTILHLKAPVGGFREKIIFPWNLGKSILKPSPTVMLFWYRHFTEKQFNGNKLMIFFKFWAKAVNKNPFSFIKKFKKDWNTSLRFAKDLDSGKIRIKKQLSKPFV